MVVWFLFTLHGLDIIFYSKYRTETNTFSVIFLLIADVFRLICCFFSAESREEGIP